MLLVVDHQVGLYNTARDFDPNLFRDQVLAHAALGKVFDIPVVLTTSTQEGMSRLHLPPSFSPSSRYTRSKIISVTSI